MKETTDKEFKWDVCDHNFKKMEVWLGACANKWEGGWEAKVTLFNVLRMVRFLEAQQKAVEDAIVESMMEVKQ